MVFDTPLDSQKRCLPLLLARAELERRNAGTPFEGAVVLQVLVGIPERTSIRGIHTHTRVVPHRHRFRVWDPVPSTILVSIARKPEEAPGARSV
jgi:hypothetical protein